jgi:urease alpha subunit
MDDLANNLNDASLNYASINTVLNNASISKVLNKASTNTLNNLNIYSKDYVIKYNIDLDKASLDKNNLINTIKYDPNTFSDIKTNNASLNIANEIVKKSLNTANKKYIMLNQV